MKADLLTKEIPSVARLNKGIIDGIKSDKNGNLIISHNEGRAHALHLINIFILLMAGEIHPQQRELSR